MLDKAVSTQKNISASNANYKTFVLFCGILPLFLMGQLVDRNESGLELGTPKA